MSMDNQTQQRAPRMRFIIAGAVAAILLGSSFYAARAGSDTGYQGGDSSLNCAEIAGMAIGGVGAAIVIMDVMKKDKDDDDASAAKSKSAKAGNVEQIRVISSQNQLTSGDAATVEVQARYQGSKTWQNVTESASINSVGLTRIDGSNNAFAVPYGTKVAAGPATIAATFGGQSASATVSVN
jgi:hypothetical protein